MINYQPKLSWGLKKYPSLLHVDRAGDYGPFGLCALATLKMGIHEWQKIEPPRQFVDSC
jgi:hypothetical protein